MFKFIMALCAAVTLSGCCGMYGNCSQPSNCSGAATCGCGYDCAMHSKTCGCCKKVMYY
jgi:hypothetical protein